MERALEKWMSGVECSLEDAAEEISWTWQRASKVGVQKDGGEKWLWGDRVMIVDQDRLGRGQIIVTVYLSKSEPEYMRRALKRKHKGN